MVAGGRIDGRGVTAGRVQPQFGNDHHTEDNDTGSYHAQDHHPSRDHSCGDHDRGRHAPQGTQGDP